MDPRHHHPLPMGPGPMSSPGVRTVPGTPVHVTGGGSSRSMISRTPSNGGARTPMTPGTPGGGGGRGSSRGSSVSHSKQMFVALYEYAGQGDDELNLSKNDLIEVLSMDYVISGDEGWWTGKCNGKVGVFPCNFVAPVDLDFSNMKAQELRQILPPHIW